jgi:DNA-binding transcriptional LysR family regulator
MKTGFTIRRDQLDGIVAFLRVAERRSFRKAAADLCVTPSALSQTVRTLEARIGVPLFHRTTRSVGLTEAGERFLACARPAMDGFTEAFDAAQLLGARPSGRLRLTLPRSVVGAVLEPVLADFCADYPDVEVELFTDSGFVDIVAEGFDAGIRLGEMLQADMIAVRITPPFGFSVVGSPGYFVGRQRPRHPEDLRDHRCIQMRRKAGGGLYRWEFEEANRAFEMAVQGSIIINDEELNIAMALRGLGLAYVPDPLVADHIRKGRLEAVLQDFCPSTPGLFLYYPSRAQALPKLRAFVDHMRSALAGYMREQAQKSPAISPLKMPR